jgi:two-component system CheB/CheR fusion protein
MKKFNPANEELQSANEELETTKEELQSSNEELQTVNEELQQRNGILAQTSNDLTNLLNSVNLPLLMLNNDLQIRQFTPLMQRLMNIRASDTGRFDKALAPRGRDQACAPMCGIPGLGF